MTLNPVIEESLTVHFRARQYRRVHAAFAGILAAATLIVWPTASLMEFFSTESVPSAFQAVAILQVLLLTGFSIYAGMDRFASARIIQYSEWLEHTQFPVSSLFLGKIGSGVLHTVVLVSLGSPFLFIAAGPAGIPVRAVLATLLILALVAFFCRVTGMLITLLGERHDVIRIIGSWVFVALLYLVTLRVFQPFNPIIAVARQQNESSPLVSTVDPVPLAENPVLPSAIWYLSAIAIVVFAYLLTMRAWRKRAPQKGSHG